MVVAQRAGTGMRRDDDARREVEHVVDGRGREMGDVEEDAEPLQLRDRAHARGRQAAAGLLVRGALGEQRPRPVRERDHAHAESVEDREQLDVGADARRPFERDEQRDPAVARAPRRSRRRCGRARPPGVCAASRSSASSWSSVERSDASATSGAT